ncbi:MAG: hypothetical protein IJ872_05285 [Eubacterium sp.]|nr:hypothetical protein [Eubacterium sp.]
MKLFEIPVYAITKEELIKKVETEHRKIIGNINPKNDKKFVESALALATFPQSLWEYNHIIGYVVVLLVKNDIVLEWYAPVPSIKRYYWKSKKKHFVQNTHMNGYHIYVGNIKTGLNLKEQINEYLVKLSGCFIDRGYYIDLEAYNNLKELIDYDKLLSYITINHNIH